MQGRERRRSHRHAVNIPAYASFNGSSQLAPREFCEILNISESGTCIQAPGPMKVNRLVPLVLDFSETNARIHTAGHVVWSAAGGKAGIRFPELPQVSLRELQHWLAANGRIDRAAPLSKIVAKTNSRSLPQSARTKAGHAAGYTSLIVEWAEIEREVELFGDNLEAAFQLIAERALAFTWATGAAIALQNRDSSDLICKARAGNDSPEIGTCLDAKAGFSGECMRAKAALKCDDTDIDSRVDRDNCRALGIRSLIACPIRIHSRQMIGIIEVFSPEPAAFWDNDMRTLERLARIIAHAITRAEHGQCNWLPLEEPEEDASSHAKPQAASAPEMTEPLTTLSPEHRSIVLFTTGILAVVLAVWLTAPWISDSMNKYIAPPKSQAAEVNSSAVDYVDTNLEDLRQLAIKGVPAAEYSLALRYAAGEDVTQDYHEALGWFLKAADLGYLRAAPKIASCFWAGRGAQQDYSKAYFWGLLAEAAGDETGHVIVINSAPHLSEHQKSAEQQEADTWLRAHHMSSTSRASR